MGLFGGGTKTEVKVLNPEVLKTKNFALGKYRDIFSRAEDFANESPDFLRAQVSREQNAALQSGEDTKRQMRDMIARRGMGNSSIGLGQMNAINKDTSDKVAGIGATLNERMRNDKLNNISTLMSYTQPGMALNVERSVQQKKKGGLGGIGTVLGGAAGAYYGAKTGDFAGGAKAGAGIGSIFD